MKGRINYYLEMLFLMLAAVIAALLLLPIREAGIDFPYYNKNIFLVFVAVLCFKHIFILPYTWLNQFQKIKIAIIPLSIPFVIVLFKMLNEFTTFQDEVALADHMNHLPFERQRFLVNYIRIEFVAVAMTAIVGGIVLPFRLLISVWREVNQR